MSIVIDDKKITNINISNKNVQKIVDELTGKIIFEKTSSNEYFYIENAYYSNNTISLITKIGPDYTTGSHATQLQYSKDKETWTTITLSGTNTIPMNSGERVYFRNDNGFFNWFNSGSYQDYFCTEIDCTEAHKVGGNINTLLDYKNPNVPITPYCFYNLFYKNKNLTGASELIFSKTSLAEGCYKEMFYDCSFLKTAPTKLPATTLADDCYNSMFENCTSLTTTPELPATTLKYNCYYGMFSKCEALTTAPALPATTLAGDCYERMFEYCTSLTTAPELPATTLAGQCYRFMFQSCTKLTTAPTLPATKLVDECYGYMFYDCTSLNNVTSYAKDIGSGTEYTYVWLNNVASTGTFHNLGSAIYPRNGNGIPTGWTEVRK